MKIRSLAAVAVGVVALALSTTAVHAAPGDPVPTFGSDGVDHWESYGDSALISRLEDGSIIFGNTVDDDPPFHAHQVQVSRYSKDDVKTWQVTFRRLRTSIHLADVVAHDGRIDVVMSDYKKDGGTRTYIARLLEDGTADPDWNGGLPVSFSKSTKSLPPRSALGTADGGLLVATDARLIKLTASGVLDTSFSGDGVAKLPQPGSSTFVLDMAQKKGGDIAFVLATSKSPWYQPFVAMLTSGGKLKKSFGVDGVRKISVPGQPLAVLQDVDWTPDGNLAVGGNVYVKHDFGAALPAVVGRLSGATGKPDPAFSDDGFVVLDSKTTTGCCVAVQDDNRILIAGAEKKNWRVTRFLPDGSKDTSFATNGTLSVRVGEGAGAEVTDLVIDRTNKRLLIAGAERDDSGGEYVAFGSFSLV